MIPITLNLKNFMSYKDLALDFSELHVACLSGENGAGKSSILDAITWCLWDKARTSNNEDLIRLGESEMSAELVFRLENQNYRVLRSTKKVGGKRSAQSSLEFQVLSDNGYKALTGKAIRETQQRLIETVKMDYATFVNSSFILQGKADEFTMKSPIERKKVLAEMLDLRKYDLYQEKAKEKLKELEIEKNQLNSDIERLRETIANEAELKNKVEETGALLRQMENNLAETEAVITGLLTEKETLSSELAGLNQINKTYRHNKQLLEEIRHDLTRINQQKSSLEQFILRKAEIEERYEKLKTLKEKEAEMTTRQIKHYELEKNISSLNNEINNEKHKLELELERMEEKLAQNRKEKEDQEKIIKEREKILSAHEKLKQAREDESNLQKKALISQRLSEKKHQLDKKLQEELHKLKITESKLRTQLAEREKQITLLPTLKLEAGKLEKRIEEFDKLQIHRDAVKEKGTKTGSDIEHNKKTITDKKQEIEVYTGKVQQWMEVHEANCPMCNTHLDETDKKKIIEKYQNDIQLLEKEIDDLEVENAKSEKIIQECRETYSELTTRMKDIKNVQQQFGEVIQQISKAEEAESEKLAITEELKQLTLRLENKQINPEIQDELAVIAEQLEKTEYNPEKLAVVQAKINDWKWSELKFSQLEQAEHKLTELENLLPMLEKDVAAFRDNLNSRAFASEKETMLNSIQGELEALAYHAEEHRQVKKEAEALKEYENLWHELHKAMAQTQSLTEEVQRLALTKDRLEKEIAEDYEKIQEISVIEEKVKNLQALIAEKTELKNNFKARETDYRTEVIKNTEKLEQYRQFKEDIKVKEESSQKHNYEIKLHKELVTAFGKNGIQAVIIENVIPEIENIANSLLYRMTEGRMNVSFTTRRANKSSDKISETLDIFISDELGTRNYEMYSGGEAFRVNFAIRLALSKILARRAGTKLKTLVIDEGFGTQDSKGISRLIEAINTISDDFEKILIITHLNELKEAFPSKIEVYKNIHGSSVKVFV